jgi:hypothetical protein
MLRRLSLLCLVVLLASISSPATSTYGADGGTFGRFGQSMGRTSSTAFRATGDFSKGCGRKIRIGSENLFKQQERFWKNFGKSFADFQE